MKRARFFGMILTVAAGLLVMLVLNACQPDAVGSYQSALTPTETIFSQATKRSLAYEGVRRNPVILIHGLLGARLEDPATGKVEVLAVHSIADVGPVGNRLTLEGQAIGGLEHGIGMALYEEYSDNVKKYETMLGCGSLKCSQMPDDVIFEFQETPRARGPFGSGGASECFQSCAHVSVLNALANATGCRFYEGPATPKAVLAALEAKKQGREIRPEKYDLGEDPDVILADIRKNPVFRPEAPAAKGAVVIEH